MFECSGKRPKGRGKAGSTGPRPEVAACYDHLGGILGEVLLRRHVELGWVQAEWQDGRTANERITPAGLEGLSAWGVDVGRLAGSGRKPVAVCTERRLGQRYDHTGALLGALLRQWLEGRAWIEKYDGGLRLTEAGRVGLVALGCRVDGS